jgi:RND superfamily putative drug exporter
LDLFVFLTALGADYNIFLLSRVREEVRAYPLREAMRHAVEATGGVITSAGIILAGTLAVLAVEPLRDTVEIGLGVALGVLLDTLVVRALLVPGVTLLLGRYAWWPSQLTAAQHTPVRRDRAGAAAQPVSLVRQEES